MAELIMPKMGDAMTEGKVVRWYKKAGDAVKKGEPVLEIETDKVNLDLEAEQDGTIADVAAQEGQMVPVGGRLAMINAPGEKQAGAGQRAAGGEEPQQEPQPQQRRVVDKKDSYKHSTGEYGEAMEMKAPRIDRSKPPATNVVAMQRAETGRRRSSPLARKMASEMGVSLDAVQGSGPQGRIVAKDIKEFGGGQGGLKAAPTLAEKQVPLSTMRRTIAKRLAESTGPIPHFYLTADYDVTNLMSLRQQMNEIEGVKISVNDFIIRAVALALLHHPNVNASWGDEAIAQHGEVHIGVAVSTPEGLITPVIRNADRKSVTDIAAEIRALAEKAKNRKLRPEEYQGSTFTVSNLGAWGIEEFTAIINPPNVAILAIGAASSQPVVVDKQVVVRDRMKVTMSCDHRVVDGAAGAEYLRTLRQYIEQPVRLII
ncbi:MAG TPA: dihydrolipoamide acetyltransferase family protein [Thermoanaerobaculia bacterium]